MRSLHVCSFGPLGGLLVGLLVSACVKGNPVEDNGEFVGTGGSLALADCGYTVTTREGAEAPKLAVAAVGADPTPRLVHLGIVGDPKTSIVVQWRTADETTKATTIRFAPGAGLTASQLTETRTGIEFGFKATGAEIYRVHQAHLCGLMPGTTYSYQVGSVGGGAEHFSPVYSFRTAPDVIAHPDAEVVLAFVGDSRGGYDTWQQIVDQIKQRSPDLILFSGDAVTVGITQYEWEDFFGHAESLFANVPMISAHGNHEVNAVNYFAQIAMPGDQENYGIDYGFAHITVGNDTPDDIGKLTGSGRDTLEADFTASEAARWKLFMHHQPMFSASTRHGPSMTLQQAWLPMVDRHHVDLVLNGHDHDYEVSKPMIAGVVQPSSENATVFVVAGGAGAELYPNGSDFWTQYSEETYSAAMIRIRRDQLTMDAFRQSGTAIPTGFSKTKP
jgi:hypothetical protein